jgi:hypothetical protein
LRRAHNEQISNRHKTVPTRWETRLQATAMGERRRKDLRNKANAVMITMG